MNGADTTNPNDEPTPPTTTRTFQAKLINGKVWIKEKDLPGGYTQLPETDPRYGEARAFLDHNARFREMIDWVYTRRHEKPRRNERYSPDDERYYTN